MRVRAADRGDVAALAALRAAWREVEPTPAFSAELARWFEQEAGSRLWWLAEDGRGLAVGMVNLKVFERMPSPDAASTRWGYLANLFVREEHRGRGVGSALVEAVLDRARDDALGRVVLSPSGMSVDLYRRHGFGPADALMVWSPQLG